jgi:large conductance mechanosensitive channel
MSARSLWQEFKSFAMKGNMIDLAVAVVIGAAFGTIVTSLVNDVIMPLISYVLPAKMSYAEWHIGRVMIGKFLAAVVNFLIIALAVFITIQKLLGTTMNKAAGTPAPEEPTTRECPYCLSVIPLKAVKCAHCTADLKPAAAAPGGAAPEALA